MKQYSTDQEAFWAGEFGDEYVTRNRDAVCIAGNVALFARALAGAGRIDSAIEFGANVGLNLRALRTLFPHVRLDAVEINETAAAELETMPDLTVWQMSLFDYSQERQYDLALVKGVLIHVNPARLGDAYRVLYDASRRYILVAEYYNPTPVAIPYRGHDSRLFKRDFAGEMMEQFPDLRLLDYGFVYHRDRNFPQDDITWFLLEKVG